MFLPQPYQHQNNFRTEDGSYDWSAELEYGWDMIDQSSCGSLAACIVEPIQGDGGVVPLPEGYLRELQAYCIRRDMLLIVDEAQTGLGRTGKLFAFEHERVIPDILTMGKPLGNGYPISAVVTSTHVDNFCRQKGFLFYTSHINDPLPAAVGDKVLEIILRDNLVQRANVLGKQLKHGLLDLKERFPHIADVRGKGLLLGVQMSPCYGMSSFEVGKAISTDLLGRGLWLNMQCHPKGVCVLRIGPPLISTEEQIKSGLEIFEKTLSRMQALYGEENSRTG